MIYFSSSEHRGALASHLCSLLDLISLIGFIVACAFSDPVGFVKFVKLRLSGWAVVVYTHPSEVIPS